MEVDWFCCIFFIKNRKIKTLVASNKKKIIFAFAVAILLIISGGFGMYQVKKDSADGRMFIWKNSIELIKQNSFGVGIGNFSGSYGHVQAAYFESGKGTEDEKRVAGNPEYAFNEYLQICAEQGIIAFLLFMCIIGYSLYIGIKRKKIAATSSFIALLIVAGASYPFSVLPFLIVFVFLLALIHNGGKGIAIPKPVSLALAFCGVVIVSLCLYDRYPTYDAYKKWNKVKMLYSFGNNKDAAEEYKSIYPLLSDQKIDSFSVLLYKNLIEYETEKVISVKNGDVYLNDSIIQGYMFLQNYYFMAGDYIFDSVDSRLLSCIAVVVISR